MKHIRYIAFTIFFLLSLSVMADGGVHSDVSWLPMLVQAVIMLVNGNVGTGVAVAGAFSLVRFRSMPGNSREITSVFAAMAAGLANGMGYLTLSLLMVVCFGVVTVALNLLLDAKKNAKRKDLKITIPESLDYYNVFEDIFEKYHTGAELVQVKTTNMGSLYELEYAITERDERRADADGGDGTVKCFAAGRTPPKNRGARRSPGDLPACDSDSRGIIMTGRKSS